MNDATCVIVNRAAASGFCPLALNSARWAHHGALDVLIFLTWKTRGSWHLISEALAQELLRLLPGLALTCEVRMIELAVVATHVHAVVRTPSSIDLPRVLQRLKGSSARLVNRARAADAHLHWDPGYDARTVGRRSLPAISRYFDSQARGHDLPWVARYSIDGHGRSGIVYDAPLAESGLISPRPGAPDAVTGR